MENFVEKYRLWFKNQVKNIIRFRWLIILFTFAITAVCFVGMKNIVTDDSFDSWMVEGDSLLVDKENFQKIFGNSEYIIVLVEKDKIFTKEVLEKIRELSNELETQVPLVDRVTSITNLDFIKGNETGICIDELIPEDIPNDRNELLNLKKLAETKPHLVNSIFNTNEKSAAIMLRLIPYPDDNTESYYRILAASATLNVMKQEKYADLKLTASGMPLVNYEKGLFYKRESARIFMISFIVMVLMLLFSLKSFVGIIAPILTTICSIIWVLGIQGFLQTKVQSMVIVFPILVILVIVVGYSVHIFSFFNQSFEKKGSRREALEYALEQASWPVFLTVVTTVLGFLSFLMVPISALRWVGITCASLVAVSYPFIVFVTPALLSFGSDKKTNKTVSQYGRMIEFGLLKFGKWVLNHGKTICIVTLLIVGAFAYYLPRVEVNCDVEYSEGRRVPYIQRLFKVAEDIGSFYSYDCAIMFPEEGMAKKPEVLKKLDEIAANISSNGIVKRTRSITDIIKDLNKSLNADKEEFYTIPDDLETVAQLMLLYEMSGGSEQEDWVDYEYKNLRLKVELKAFNKKDFEKQRDYIKTMVKEYFPGAKIIMTGSVVTFMKMIDYMVSGQLWSIVMALITIGAIMVMIFGSVKLGFIGMIPNIIPLVLVGGTMGALDIPLDFITVMVAPMILGIAVDDTIHFITHFQSIYTKTGRLMSASLNTFRSVGLAMFLSSAILVLGFAAFGSSVSNGYVSMSILVIVSVVSALLADYFITPNLIKWVKAV